MNKKKCAKQYADLMQKKCEELHGHKCTISDMYYRNADIQLAFETGWEEALKSQWISTKVRPKLYDKILVLYKIDGSYMISQTKYFGFVARWKFGCNDILAWMPIPSFDKILEDNKDVLKRLKDK